MLLRRFVHDRRAGVAPFFAASLIPMVGLIGAAVDYSRANAAVASLRSAADSTALAMSKLAPTLSPAQLQSNANAYFNALIEKPSLKNVSVDVKYSNVNGSKIDVMATATVSTWFMNVWPFNFGDVPVSVSATSTWGTKRLRVALVLDNTGSMADNNKMPALKTASHNLLSQLKTAAQNDGDVYVSIIPFSKDVNLGSDKHEEPWIDWTYWDAKNGVCSKSWLTSKQTCMTGGGTWTPNPHNTWNGCVMDRDQNYDTLNTPPASGANFPAEEYGSCPVPMMALSYDWTALNAKIDQMSPVGYTNQTIGLAWGWQSLSQGAPLNAPALDPNYQYQQVIILLTDGLNTQNRWSNNQSSVDARTEKVCANAKAAGITIYTVLVMAGNSSLLQNCATDSKKYFKLTSADQIITTFETIGTNLSQLRLAK